MIGSFIWFETSYKQISFLNLSVTKKQALTIAQNYIHTKHNVNSDEFTHAVILRSRNDADRFLQRTIGFDKEIDFIKENDFNLFYWAIRFFKENQKEEFFVGINPKNGEVILFNHVILDTDKRASINLETSKKLAQQFLRKTFNFNFKNYTLKEESTEKYDNRTDYYFSWQKNNIEIPWSNEKDSGTAKLITKLTVSGNEILSFQRNTLDIPDRFSRMIENSKQSGRILTALFVMLYFLMLMMSVYLVIIQKNSTAMHATKKFYIKMLGFVFILMIIFNLNNIQNFLFDYSTASTLKVFFFELSLYLLISASFFAFTLIQPGLAGEAIAESNQGIKQKGFLDYISSKFLSKDVFSLVVLGYLSALIMLGIQSTAFYFGHQFFNVWTERMQIPQLSSAFWPFLTVFIIAVRASLSEEIMFRFFGIHIGTKIFKNVIVAAILSSIIWGFGHTHYPIFPAWFRGLEVSLLGFFLSFIYLRFGIIPVIICHYLFDAFWGASGFIFGKSHPFDFATCLLVLLLPFIWGIAAFFINRKKTKKNIFKLDPNQEYNLRILKTFLHDSENWDQKSIEQIKNHLLTCGWDAIIINQAVDDIKNTTN